MTTIDGKYLSSKPIGFCHCKLHYGYLTTHILKQHECLNKQCCWLQKYSDHPYWKQRERIKQLRKQRKSNISR